MIANVGADFVTVFPRHVDVGKNDAGRQVFKRLDGGVAVAHLDNLKIRIGESLRHQAPDRWAVVSQKDCSSHMH